MAHAESTTVPFEKSVAEIVGLVRRAGADHESGVETFEQTFLANVVLPDGSTVYERIAEPIAVEYDGGAPGSLMLSGPRP